MGNPIVLKMHHIKKNFGGICALKGIDFELEQGKVHALLGENGAGKSTMIKIITGVHQADEGKIFLNGNLIKVHNPIDARKKGIAAIYQELSLIESLTVAENIFLGNEPTFSPIGIYDRSTLYKRSREYLERFGIDIDYKQKIADLGMGQKRIIEIVKALALDAKILLLDEPTTGMSKAEIETLFQIIENLKKNNVTMIYISHYLDEVFRISNRTTVFRDGKNAGTFNTNKVTFDELVKCMIGKKMQISSKKRIRNLDTKETALELIDFKTNRMKEKVSLCVRKSEILGITGIIGAGKSELAHSIFGNAKLENGEIRINDKKAHIHSAYSSKNYKIAFIPEDRKSQGLFLRESLANNMTIVSLEQIENRFRLLSNKRKKENTNTMGKKIRVNPLNTDLQVGNLSGGNQQKVVIGKWLMGDPDIIVMDEPTRGIDIGAKSEIYSLIQELAEKDKAIILMSSEFKELVDLCDRILVLCKGKIVGELASEDADSQKLLSLSLGG